MPEAGVIRLRFVWKFGQVCIRHWLFKARLTSITTHQSPFTNQDSPAKSDNIHLFNPPEKTAQLPPSADFPLSRRKVLLARECEVRGSCAQAERICTHSEGRKQHARRATCPVWCAGWREHAGMGILKGSQREFFLIILD